MLSFYKKYYKTVFDIALIVLTVYIFMLLFSYLYRIATPIFLAFLIFAAIEPLAKLLHRKGLRKSIASGISILLFVLVILGALVGIGVIFTNQIINLSQKLPDYSVTLQEQIAQIADYLHTKWNALPAGVADKSKEYAASITSFGAKLGQSFLIWLVAWLTSFSSFIVNFTIGIILAYFLSTEIETWKQMAHARTPKTFKTAFFFLKENVFIGILGYLKAQFKMVSITFAVILIALLALGVHNAFSIALLAGVFDLLPLLGVSTVFIPWIIYLIIVGQTPLAIELSVLLALVILVRQILEPKITGDTLGVSAFTMLSAMIISLSVFGVSGLILSPILIILLKALYDQGYLSRWIRLPEDYDHHQ
jgi:sporulation integral membrane protein YtvI